MVKILIDTVSSMDILYKDALDLFGLTPTKLQPLQTLLYGFAGNVVIPLGIIALLIIVGEEPSQTTMIVNLVVIDHSGAYNMILGRPFVFNTKAVVSMYHLGNEVPNGRKSWNHQKGSTCSETVLCNLYKVICPGNHLRSPRINQREEG
ncbi:hypothetical protein ACOSQ2_024352 [Xanthoceras sorbifolium]